MSGKRLLPGLFSSISDADLFSAMLEAESDQSSDETTSDTASEPTNPADTVK